MYNIIIIIRYLVDLYYIKIYVKRFNTFQTKSEY